MFLFYTIIMNYQKKKAEKRSSFEKQIKKNSITRNKLNQIKTYTLKTIQQCRKLKMILQRSEKISCAHGLKESIQLKFHTTQSNQKFNPQESTHDIFHRTRTNNSSEEPRQYTQQRTKLGVSQSLTSNCVCVLSCVQLCDPMGFSVHGISQARILERVAISFPRGSSRPRERTCIFGVSLTGRQVLHYTTKLQQ